MVVDSQQDAAKRAETLWGSVHGKKHSIQLELLIHPNRYRIVVVHELSISRNEPHKKFWQVVAIYALMQQHRNG